MGSVCIKKTIAQIEQEPLDGNKSKKSTALVLDSSKVRGSPVTMVTLRSLPYIVGIEILGRHLTTNSCTVPLILLVLNKEDA